MLIPDFFISNTGGKLELSLNSKNCTRSPHSEGYKEMLKDIRPGQQKRPSAERGRAFIKQKRDAANGFIERHQTAGNRHSLIPCTRSWNYQHEFFLTGDETTAAADDPERHAETTALGYFHSQPVANSKSSKTEFGITV